MTTCKDCKHWNTKDNKWGKCPFARMGRFINKGNRYYPCGYDCNHTDSRYRGNRSCKKHFERKGVMMDQYYDNPRIKAYVDKFCVKEKMSVQQALKTAMVKNFIEYVNGNKNTPDVELKFVGKE